MAVSILIQDSLEVPFIGSLDGFRAWAASDSCPQQGRIDFITGPIEIGMTPENLHRHGTLKTRLAVALGQIIDSRDLGELSVDRTRVSSPQADLSAEPDLAVEIVGDQSVGKDTKRLPAACHAAGIAEFWLPYARSDVVDFRIRRRAAEGYQAVTPDADGFRFSSVFGQAFQLVRRKNRAGGRQYDLKVSPTGRL